ncbi:MAG: DUF5675 family protein [Tannerellaceae bacterium]
MTWIYQKWKFKNRPYSQYCDGKLPRLNNIKGFKGVLVHVGNSPKDTLGCILVEKSNTKGLLVNSANTFIDLIIQLNSTSDVWTCQLLLDKSWQV